MFNFIAKKSFISTKFSLGLALRQLEWIWISNYVLLLSDVYLHFFHDDNSDLTIHLQDKMDIVQWISRLKIYFLKKKQSLHKEQRCIWSFIVFPSSFSGMTDEIIDCCPLVAMSLANPTRMVKWNMQPVKRHFHTSRATLGGLTAFSPNKQTTKKCNLHHSRKQKDTI